MSRGPESAPMLAAAPVLVRLQGAGVRFGAHTVLQAVDLEVHAGERVALIGSNGSGKTTLLRLLHGQVPHLGLRQVHTDAQGREPSQAMVFQRPFLLRLSVWWNLQLALWLAGVPRAQRAWRWSGSTWPNTPTVPRGSCPAGNNSAWLWRAHGPCGHSCCFWMSPPPA